MCEYKLCNIPMEWFYFFDSTKHENIFIENQGIDLSNDIVGIHWYGGDHLSIDMADSLTLTWPEESKSLIARAWRRAQSATRETVGEQHGFA